MKLSPILKNITLKFNNINHNIFKINRKKILNKNPPFSLKTRKYFIPLTAAFTFTSITATIRHFHHKYFDSLDAKFADPKIRSVFLQHHPTPLLSAILVANCLIFALWKSSRFFPSLQDVLRRHFTLDPALILKNRRIHTLATHMFSHSNSLHFLMNAICFTSFAIPLIQAVGMVDFSRLYFLGGMSGALLYVLSAPLFGTFTPALGLSAGALSIISCFSLLYPFNKVSIIFFPFISFNAWIIPFAILAFDFIGLIFKFRIFCHAGHIGGTLFGLLYFSYLQRTKGTTKNGKTMVDLNIYEGPMKEYKPINTGLIHTISGKTIKREFEPITEENSRNGQHFGPSIIKN